jgi:hypothetical protein
MREVIGLKKGIIHEKEVHVGSALPGGGPGRNIPVGGAGRKE